jgi:spore coat protein CotF
MKQYTLDGALLTETPEIRIGDKIYKVDNRCSQVKKLEDINQNDMDSIFRVALGDKATEEIMAMDMLMPAMIQLNCIIVAAMTDDTPERVRDRFQRQLEG